MPTLSYPARFAVDDDDFIVVTFRDLPELGTNARDANAAHAMAIDVLAVGLWLRLKHGEPIPRPSRPRKGEVPVAAEPAVALKIALIAAVAGRRGAAARIARELGIQHKEARRLLDPTESNRADRLARALALFGHAATVTIERRPAA